MEFKLGMKVGMGYIFMVILMTLTLMQVHSDSAEEQIQLWIISKTKQAIKIKLSATVGHDQ